MRTLAVVKGNYLRVEPIIRETPKNGNGKTITRRSVAFALALCHRDATL